LLLGFLLACVLSKSQPTDGYVVSWSYDTLPVRILYIDILQLQKVLRVESPVGGVEVL